MQYREIKKTQNTYFDRVFMTLMQHTTSDDRASSATEVRRTFKKRYLTVDRFVNKFFFQ